MTVSAFFIIYEADRPDNVSCATHVSYLSCIKNHLLPYYGNLQISDISSDNIDTIRLKLEAEEIPKSTLGGIQAAFLSFFNYAIEKNVLSENPVSRGTPSTVVRFYHETDIPCCTKDSAPTFKLYVRHFLDEGVSLSDQSKQTYIKHLTSNVFPTIGDMPMDQISQQHTADIVDAMRRKGTPENSVKEVYRITKRILTVAVREGVINTNPCSVQFSWNKDPSFSFPENIEQHNLLINSLEKLPLRNVYGFCYYTGISLNKAITIRRSTLNLQEHTLYLKGSPNEGIIPIPDPAFLYVKAAADSCLLIGETEDDLLFVKPSGTHICIADIFICTQILRALLNIPKFKSRSICRCYCNMLKLTNGDIPV